MIRRTLILTIKADVEDRDVLQPLVREALISYMHECDEGELGRLAYETLDVRPGLSVAAVSVSSDIPATKRGESS